MANTTIALGTLSGIVGIAAGVALQHSASPVLNTVGQVAVWGGLINVGAAVGLAAVSTQWKRWRQEVQVLSDLSEMEMDIGQGLPARQTDVLNYAALAERCTQLFENAKPKLAQEIVHRMDAVGSTIVQRIPAEDKNAVRSAIAYSMAAVRLGLGQPGLLANTVVPAESQSTFKPDLENDAQTRSMFQWR